MFKWILLAGLAASFLTACGEKKNPTWEYMPNMTNAPSVKAQEEPMRAPPAGTLPIDFERYPYSPEEGELAGAALKNPLRPTKETLLRGRTVYNNTCVVCHGPRGKGNGYIVPKFPQPPSLLSEKIRDWTDGRLYHVITRGQNLMGSYATLLPPKERWAVIHYIRVLQRASQPTENDIKAFKTALEEKRYP